MSDQPVEFKFQLDFNPHEDDHRQAATWLSAQPDPTEAVTRLVRVSNTARLRLQQWEELATLLANEVRELRALLVGQQEVDELAPGSGEDPESARRLDSIFG
jgi:hypothetical protein